MTVPQRQAQVKVDEDAGVKCTVRPPSLHRSTKLRESRGMGGGVSR